MIKAVIFDYGGVVRFCTDQQMYDTVAAGFGMTNSEIRPYRRPLQKQLESYKITEEQFWRRLSKSLGKPLPKNYMKLWLVKYILLYRRRKGVLELIEKLKAKGYQVPLLSNTIPSHVKYNKSKGYFKMFNPVILSTEVGMRKAELRIYRFAAKKSKCKPSECVFIDDKKRNIEAAREVGMKGIQFKSIPQLKADLKKLKIEF